MAIRQVSKDETTKDGRSWIVDLTYNDLLGRRHRYHSKKLIQEEMLKIMKQNLK